MEDYSEIPGSSRQNESGRYSRDRKRSASSSSSSDSDTDQNWEVSRSKIRKKKPEGARYHKVMVGGARKGLFTDKDNTSKTYSSKDPVVEVLKNRIRQLESREKNGEVCSVCLGPYHRPVISVCCWHVHCEECWLQALSFQEICPKCRTCTYPADLRRIYL